MQERGQYITLLCEQHQLQSIPDNHIKKILPDPMSPVWKKFKKDNDGTWYNQRMRDETNLRKNYIKSRRKNAYKRWNKEDKPLSNKKINTMHMHMHTDMHMGMHRDNENEDENRDRNNINKRSFIAPTLEEVKAYCKEKKHSSIADKAYEYYSELGWRDSTGKKIKSWKAKLLAVWFKPENRDELTIEERTARTIKYIEEMEAKNGSQPN